MMQIAAVVDATPDIVVVWHVDIGTDNTGLSRMCGAWVLDNEPHKLELLTRDRLIVATTAGAEALPSSAKNPTAILDLAGIRANIAEERERLQRLYDELPPARKKTLVAPRWPQLPACIELDTLPPTEHTESDHIALALGIGRYLEQLATVWSAIEGQRTTRSYLANNSPGQPTVSRKLPLAWLVAPSNPSVNSLATARTSTRDS
jgi:hypothetical protein